METLSCEINTVVNLIGPNSETFKKGRERAQVEAGPRWWSSGESKGSKLGDTGAREQL